MVSINLDSMPDGCAFCPCGQHRECTILHAHTPFDSEHERRPDCPIVDDGADQGRGGL